MAKSSAAFLLSIAWTMGSLGLLCRLAGQPGNAAFHAIWPAILASTLAYVAMFQLFSVVFRKATIVALGYSLFLETLVGNMPGIVKRLTICFYSRCMIFESSSDLGIGASGPFNAVLFQPIPSTTAQTVLYAVSAALLLAGLLVFAKTEY